MSQRAPPQRGTPKQRARARVRLRLANDRQSERRDAVHEMNLVAEEYSLPPIPRKASTRRVQRLVRILQQRVRTAEHLAALHAAAHRWQDNGGDLGGELLPLPTADEGSAGTDGAPWSD